MHHNLPGRSWSAGLPTDPYSEESQGLDHRRLAMGASLLGMASMAAVVLFQIGAIRHLPDPPVDGFDSDHVNDPERASVWGFPDGFCKLSAHAIMLALIAAWTADRAERRPWLPFFAAGFALGQAIAAGRTVWRMPKADKAWCGYRLVDAVAHFTAAALMLPTVIRALYRRMRHR